MAPPIRPKFQANPDISAWSMKGLCMTRLQPIKKTTKPKAPSAFPLPRTKRPAQTSIKTPVPRTACSSFHGSSIKKPKSTCAFWMRIWFTAVALNLRYPVNKAGFWTCMIPDETKITLKRRTPMSLIIAGIKLSIIRPSRCLQISDSKKRKEKQSRKF